MNTSAGISISSNEVKVVLILHNSTLKRVSDNILKVRVVGRNQRWYPIETCNEYTDIHDLDRTHSMQQNTVKIQTYTTNALSTNQRYNRYALDVASNGKIQTYTSNAFSPEKDV
jgi:Bacterial macroglobulin domain 6